LTGVAANVCTPAGSWPLLARASHSQPTIDDPTWSEVSGACSASEV
jgi:hypothetical protein